MTDISTDEQEFKLQFIDGKHSVVMHVAKIFCAKLTFPHNSMLFSITFKEKVTFSPKNCTIRHISRTFVTRAADIENMDAFLLLYYTVMKNCIIKVQGLRKAVMKVEILSFRFFYDSKSHEKVYIIFRAVRFWPK